MRKNFSAALLTVLLAGTANAAVVYELDGASVTGPNVTVNLASGSHTLRIYSTTGVDAIPAVTLSGTAASGAELCIIVASTSTTCGGASAFTGGASFGGLSFQSGSENLCDASSLTLNVSGNVNGDITVGRVNRIMPGGSIVAGTTITATAADAGATRAISLIQPDGAILGSIVASSGSIGEVRSLNGPIGPTPGTPGPTIFAAGSIGTIQAEEINAVITAGGTLNFLNATTGGVHGLIQVDELVDESPFDNVKVFQTEAVSSARIEVDSVNWLLSFGAGLTGDPEWSGLFVAGDVTADIIAAGPIDNIRIEGDVCTRCTAADSVSVAIGSGTSVGNLYIGGTAGDSLNGPSEGLTIQSPSFDRIEIVGEFFGRIANGDIGATAVPICILHGGVNASGGNDACYLSLSDVELLDIRGNVNSDCSVLMPSLAPESFVHVGGATGGPIIITDADGLQGQINVEWGGAYVFVGPGPYTDPAPSGTSLLVDDYSTLPSEFGDGAAGEVPFTVHDEASDSYNLDTSGSTPVPTVTWSEFNQDSECEQDIIVEFYGPVRLTDDPAVIGPLLSVVLQDQLPQGGVNTELSHLMRFTLVGTTPTGKRQVRIDAAPGQHLPWGTYVVKNWRDSRVKPLVCDDLLTEDEVPVADFEYTFVIANDCAVDDVFDCIRNEDCGIPFPYTLCDTIDFNNDGLFPDTTDISDFVQVFGAGACSTGLCNDIDFNNDGLFPDTLDITALLSAFGGGPCLL